MQITVRLYGILQEHRPRDCNTKSFTLNLEDGAMVGSVVNKLGIPEDILLLAFIDKQQVPLETPLNNGINLWLFPPVAGG